MDDARPSDPTRTSRPRVPTVWFVGLTLALLLPALTGAPAVSLVLGGLYLVVTAGWAPLRRRRGAGALGRRGLGAVVGVGVVVLLAGGAVAGPAEPVAEPSTGPRPTAVPTDEPAPETVTPRAEPTEPPSPAPAAPEATAPPRQSATGPGTALAAARELEVKGRAPRTGYERDLFGSGWVDTDRNGCDTRNDILARDLTELFTIEGVTGA